MAWFSLFMTTVLLGLITIFDLGSKINFYFYVFYSVYNIIFAYLLIVRIPFFKLEERNK